MALRTVKKTKSVRERLVAVRFTPEELKYLQGVAKERDTTVSDLIRRGLIETGAVPAA